MRWNSSRVVARQSMTSVLILFSLTVVLGCTAHSPNYRRLDSGVNNEQNASEAFVDLQAIYPFISPPTLDWSQATMPAVGHQHQLFPLLPGDKSTLSRSIGTVSSGYLVNAQVIEQPHPNLAFLEKAFERGLFYTTHQIKNLVSDAALFVAQKYPEDKVYLGNFSAPRGGDIPYSASHNSGRDADLAFFLIDETRNLLIPPEFVPLDDNGQYNCEETSQTYTFDSERNWRLIEGLIRSKSANIQYIFVSNALRAMLLAEARRQNVSRRIYRRADHILVQPRGALPHNDHFHVRVHCDDHDMESGCVETGRRHASWQSAQRARSGAVHKALKYLEHENQMHRLAAARRLEVLDAVNAAPRLEERLSVERDPRVRAAIARSLGAIKRGTQVLQTQLLVDDSPEVIVEIINALGQIGTDDAVDGLVGFLEHSSSVDIPLTQGLDARVFAVTALIASESKYPVKKLIDLLAIDDTRMQVHVAHSLRMLTNQQFGENWHVATAEQKVEWYREWRLWFEQSHDQTREQWLVEGFLRKGYDLDQLSGAYVWELCRAIIDVDHVSFNAQRVLMNLAGFEPASLSWSKEDASFYWRRWFERRWKDRGYPPIPIELSTLIELEDDGSN